MADPTMEPPQFLIDDWDNAICAKPSQIDDINMTNPKCVGVGLIFKRQRVTTAPESIQAPYGADHWLVYIIGSSADWIDDLITQMVTQFNETANYTANTVYSRFWLDINNVQFVQDFEDKPCTQQWRVAVADVWGSRKAQDSHGLYDPRYNTKLGGEK